MTKKKYIVNRILQMIPMLFIISIIAFTLSNMATGDIAEIKINSEGGQPTPEAIKSMREQLGLNHSIVYQYFEWLKNVFLLDFGKSFRTDQPVWDEIIYRFPATFLLAICSSFLSLFFAIPSAIISVKYNGKFIDHIIRILSTLGTSMPSFLIGLILLYVFSIYLGWAPVISGSSIYHIFLPALTLSIGYASIYTRMIRSNLLEIVGKTYMKSAKVKGLSPYKILYKHGLKNAIIPAMTLIGSHFGTLVTGSFAVEMIFSWNGIGKFAIESVQSKDLPVIQGYLLFVAVAFVLINLLIDICYTYIDPKIKIK